jgi:hypothetical protein
MPILLLLMSCHTAVSILGFSPNGRRKDFGSAPALYLKNKK